MKINPARTGNKARGALRFLAVLLGSAFLSLPALAQPGAYDSSHDGRGGRSGELAKRLDNPNRDATQKPDEVIRVLALRPNAIVADIGAGTGYFATRLARMVPQGKVYAIEIDPEMVRTLKERAASEKLVNLVAIQAAAQDPMLPGPVDLALMVNVYQAIRDREAYICALREKITPTGRLAILSHRPGTGGNAPESRRFTSAQIKAEFEKCGYALVEEHDFLPQQHFLIFKSRAD